MKSANHTNLQLNYGVHEYLINKDILVPALQQENKWVEHWNSPQRDEQHDSDKASLPSSGFLMNLTPIFSKRSQAEFTLFTATPMWPA